MQGLSGHGLQGADALRLPPPQDWVPTGQRQGSAWLRHSRLLASNPGCASGRGLPPGASIPEAETREVPPPPPSWPRSLARGEEDSYLRACSLHPAGLTPPAERESGHHGGNLQAPCTCRRPRGPQGWRRRTLHGRPWHVGRCPSPASMLGPLGREKCPPLCSRSFCSGRAGDLLPRDCRPCSAPRWCSLSRI